MQMTRHEDGAISQVGRVVRITHGQPPAEQPAPEVSTLRTGNQSYQLDYGTGEVTTRGHASYQAGATPENPQRSIMGSLQSMGGQKTVELEPGNPASRTLLSIALKDGLVVETAPGVFVDRSQFSAGSSQEGPSGNVEAPSGAPEESTLGIYDEAELGIWSEEIADIPQHSYDKAVAGVTAALAGAAPERLDGVIAALAEGAGMEPERAREFVETGIEWYARTVGRDLESAVGMTSQQVEGLWDKLRDSGHPRFIEAIQEVTTTGQASVFREIGMQFKRQFNQAVDMSTFHAQGFESAVDAVTGDLLIRRPGQGWQSLSELAKGKA